MYSDFYEIPLPALRFEKVEETDTKKWQNDTEEKRRLPNSTTPKENDAQIQKSRFTRKKTTRKEDSKTLPEEKAFVIREIKLTNSKNGRH